MDYGKDHYATVTFDNAPEGRRVAIAWMSNWQYAAEVPTMQFRSANTLPREIGLFMGADGQVYASSMPSPEVAALRGDVVSAASRFTAKPGARDFKLPVANDGVCEITMDIDLNRSKKVVLELSNRQGDKVTMTCDGSTFSFDRNNSGIVDFSQEFPAVTESPTFSGDRKVSLRIFVDRSSIEVFGEDGRFAMTNLVFPNEPYSTLSVSAEGGNASVSNLKIYSINIDK